MAADTTSPAVHDVSYAYGPLGDRSEKDVDGMVTRYISSGAHEIAEYDGSGNVLRRFVYGDQPIVKIEYDGQGAETERHFYLADHQGSISAVTDSTGAVAHEYAYSPFGDGASLTGNPFQYAGRRFDQETGLFYNRARYFSASLGRFLQPDPIGFAGGMNLYGYVGNDPVNNTDPSGLSSCNIRAGCEVREGAFNACLNGSCVLPILSGFNAFLTSNGFAPQLLPTQQIAKNDAIKADREARKAAGPPASRRGAVGSGGSGSGAGGIGAGGLSSGSSDPADDSEDEEEEIEEVVVIGGTPRQCSVHSGAPYCGAGDDASMFLDKSFYTGGVDFGRVCLEVHDPCYSTPGAEKLQCDYLFYEALQAACFNQIPGDGLLDRSRLGACLKAARTYRFAVEKTKTAADAFATAQMCAWKDR